MDKELLEWYDYGWQYEAGHRVYPYGLQDKNLKAFGLGRFHYRLGDDCKSFDSLTDEEILKMIKYDK